VIARHRQQQRLGGAGPRQAFEEPVEDAVDLAVFLDLSRERQVAGEEQQIGSAAPFEEQLDVAVEFFLDLLPQLAALAAAVKVREVQPADRSWL
jgi:hypothetical protein